MNALGRALLAALSVAIAAGRLVRSRPNPPRRGSPPRALDDALLTGDQFLLPLRAWRPDGQPLAVVLAVHGFADWRRSFEISGPLFAARRLLVYAYDQRGFGDTRSSGVWSGVDPLVEDLAEAASVIGRQHPDLPLVVLGESAGASLALLAAARAEAVLADALVLAAPGVWADLRGRELHDVALRLAGPALPWLSAELRRGGHPWLVPEEAHRLGHDPKILRRLPAGAYEGLVELTRRASDVMRTNHLPPTFVLHGALDPVVPEEAIARLVSRLGPHASLISYPRRHHLLLHEEDVERVVDDVLAWLEPLLPAAPAARHPAGTAASDIPPETPAAQASDRRSAGPPPGPATLVGASAD